MGACTYFLNSSGSKCKRMESLKLACATQSVMGQTRIHSRLFFKKKSEISFKQQGRKGCDSHKQQNVMETK